MQISKNKCSKQSEVGACSQESYLKLSQAEGKAI